MNEHPQNFNIKSPNPLYKMDRIINIFSRTSKPFRSKMTIKFGESTTDRYITNVYYWSGLWFNTKPSLLYRIFSFFFLFILILPWVLCLDIGFVLSDNLSDATHILCSSLPVSVFFAKAMNLYVNNKRIQSCLERVHNFRLLDPEEKEFANNQLRTFFKFAAAFTIACNVTVIFICWRVAAIEKTELPFGAWYPLDWEHNNRDFWIAQTIQFYGMTIAVNVNMACELFPCFFLTVIGCQLEILGMRLEKLNSELSVHGKENSEIIQKLIDEHVQTHYYIMKLVLTIYIDEMKKIFNCGYLCTL